MGNDLAVTIARLFLRNREAKNKINFKDFVYLPVHGDVLSAHYWVCIIRSLPGGTSSSLHTYVLYGTWNTKMIT